MDTYLRNKIKAVSFILIIFIVYLHSYNLNSANFLNIIIFYQYSKINIFAQEFVSGGLTRTAVPLFFIISGFLFFHNISKFNSYILFYKYKIKSRIKTLLIPYFIWSILGMLIFITLQSIPISKPFFAHQPITSLSFCQILQRIFINPIPYQLWFIQDIIGLTIISPILYYLIKYFNYSVLIIFLGNWLFNPIYSYHSEALLFFCIGSFFALDYNFKIKLGKKMVFSLLIIWIALLFINTFIKVYQNNYMHSMNNILNKLIILVGLISLWYSYDFSVLYRSAKLKELQNFTFFLYAAHEPMLTIFKKGLAFINFSPLVIYLLAPVMTIIIVLICGLFTKKYSYRFYNLITGGR
jgi:surface polysaccharide O-acyltransferase-like enzyme